MKVDVPPIRLITNAGMRTRLHANWPCECLISPAYRDGHRRSAHSIHQATHVSFACALYGAGRKLTSSRCVSDRENTSEPSMRATSLRWCRAKVVNNGPRQRFVDTTDGMHVPCRQTWSGRLQDRSHSCCESKFNFEHGINGGEQLF